MSLVTSRTDRSLAKGGQFPKPQAKTSFTYCMYNIVMNGHIVLYRKGSYSTPAPGPLSLQQPPHLSTKKSLKESLVPSQKYPKIEAVFTVTCDNRSESKEIHHYQEISWCTDLKAIAQCSCPLSLRTYVIFCIRPRKS